MSTIGTSKEKYIKQLLSNINNPKAQVVLKVVASLGVRSSLGKPIISSQLMQEGHPDIGYNKALSDKVKTHPDGIESFRPISIFNVPAIILYNDSLDYRPIQNDRDKLNEVVAKWITSKIMPLIDNDSTIENISEALFDIVRPQSLRTNWVSSISDKIEGEAKAISLKFRINKKKRGQDKKAEPNIIGDQIPFHKKDMDYKEDEIPSEIDSKIRELLTDNESSKEDE